MIICIKTLKGQYLNNESIYVYLIDAEIDINRSISYSINII